MSKCHDISANRYHAIGLKVTHLSTSPKIREKFVRNKKKKNKNLKKAHDNA